MLPLRDPCREGGAVAEQGALQQALRRIGGAGLRERGGTPGGEADGTGGEHGASDRFALLGALGRQAAPATAATDGGGRNLSRQEGQVPFRGVQSGDC